MACAIDYAWAHPNPQAIKDAGYVAVLRYFSTDPSKDISAAERDALWAVGLGIRCVWETTATRATQGTAAGAVDAQAARSQATGIGYPLPIYFAVDEDTTWASVAAYFAGAVSVLGRSMVEPYGSDAVVEGFYSTYGGSPGGWQTMAWSGRAVSAHAALYQRVSPTLPPVAGAQGEYDEDAILAPIAWWHSGAQQTDSTPTPAPTYQTISGDADVATAVKTSIATDSSGSGYSIIAGDPEKVVSVVVFGFNPAGAGVYWHDEGVSVTGTNTAGQLLVEIAGSEVKDGHVTVKVWLAA